MKTLKIRNLLAAALFTVMIFGSNVLPAAAQTFTPVPMGCYFQGTTYPVGTVLRFLLPGPEPTYVYMRCELKLNQLPPGSARPQWVYYSSNPS